MSAWPPPGETNIAFSGAVAALIRTTANVTLGGNGEEIVESASNVSPCSKNSNSQSEEDKKQCSCVDNQLPCYECCIAADRNQSYTPPPVYKNKFRDTKKRSRENTRKLLHSHAISGSFHFSHDAKLCENSHTLLPSFLVLPQ